ncbi:MAG: MogA/MoaB family molybdenum cofactor biosynthesis protein [Chloroflexi bacterium]|nr:MogA/MoaB family molybdenum cofactor biosynthesis protein [Chloroflexota bacterium]
MRFGILTISDRSSRGERLDVSGPALMEAVIVHGGQVVVTGVVPDEIEVIRRQLSQWVESGLLDVILTTGGTGFAPRDVTPEATRLVIERLTPGLDEAMRAASLKITPHAMLSRAITGISKRTIIINLPGSPRGALENLQVVLPVLAHAVKLLHDDPDSEKGHLASKP